MDEALFALLSGTAAVTAICGPHIYWGGAPQGAPLPYVVMHIISGVEGRHLRGTDGFWSYRVQIDCIAVDRPKAVGLSRAIVSALNGHGIDNERGIRGAFIDGTREDPEDAASGRPSRISTDFVIKWRG